MHTKTRAIVLRSFKYSESQLIIDMLTEEVGRVSFICHVSRSAKARLKPQFFQPLSLLDLEFDFRPSAGLQHLREVRVALPFVSIPFEPYKLSMSLFLAEFLYYCTRDEQRNTPLFSYVMQSIEWLDRCSTHFSNFHLVFMLRLSRFIGFFPNLDDYRSGDYFDLREGAFCSSAPLHVDYLVPAEARLIGLLMRMDYTTMHLFRMSQTERNRCIDVLLTFYRLHVPAFPELKSLAVLRELYL